METHRLASPSWTTSDSSRHLVNPSFFGCSVAPHSGTEATRLLMVSKNNRVIPYARQDPA